MLLLRAALLQKVLQKGDGLGKGGVLRSLCEGEAFLGEGGAAYGGDLVREFVGALHGRRARKGVFITTSAFSDEARQYAAGIDSKLALIDGAQLADLMIDFDLGVSPASTYTVKRIDSDFFGEE